ncbi:hypothetical protein ABIC44_002682 [Sphingomonas sp. 1185]
MVAKEGGIERRVEVKGIADLGERRIARLGAAEAPRHRRGGADRIGGERLGLARLVQAPPQRLERHRARIEAIDTEGVEIALPAPPPVGEFDAQLECAARRADEVAFADADRTDLFEFDQRDRRSLRPRHAGERGCGHPVRRSSADDRDIA